MALRFPDGKGPHMIVDDGGDASLYWFTWDTVPKDDAETINRKGGNHEEQVIWILYIASWKKITDAGTVQLQK